jgi:hypothetical protein
MNKRMVGIMSNVRGAEDVEMLLRLSSEEGEVSEFVSESSFKDKIVGLILSELEQLNVLKKKFDEDTFIKTMIEDFEFQDLLCMMIDEFTYDLGEKYNYKLDKQKEEDYEDRFKRKLSNGTLIDELFPRDKD